MASLQPIGGINCGPSHRPQLAQPLPTKKKMSLPKGISSNVKKVLDKDERKLKLVKEQQDVLHKATIKAIELEKNMPRPIKP
jgi:hypothetical protein